MIRLYQASKNIQRGSPTVVRLLVLTAFLVACCPISAGSITYQFVDATLDQGGLLTGEFSYDPSTEILTDLTLSLSAGGGDEGGGQCSPGVLSGNQGYIAPTCGSDSLDIVFNNSLGGTTDFLELDGNSLDINGRQFTHGEVQEVITPEPTTGLTVLLGAAMLYGFSRYHKFLLLKQSQPARLQAH
jgi:hypothetical protein